MATSTPFSFKIHGNNVPNSDCGGYPDIDISFTIIFDRTGARDNQQIVWHTEGMSWRQNSTAGTRYDYNLYVYLMVNGAGLHQILGKGSTYGSGWESSVSVSNIGETEFLSTVNSTNVAIYVKSSGNNGSYFGCKHGSNHINCYQGAINIDSVNYTCLYDVGGVELPTYETFSTVYFHANGGQGGPTQQTKSSVSGITLTSEIPYYPITITYHKDTPVTQNSSRLFQGWNSNSAGTGNNYAPGGSYTSIESDLYAKWGDASFLVYAIYQLDRKYFVLTYDARGGTTPRATDSLERNRLGYSTNPSATTASYIVGNPTPYTTQTNLDLYPIYSQSVSINSANFPTPTRSGYLFNGWYTQGGQKITGVFTITSDTTIYAGWTPLPVHRFQSNGTWNNEGPFVLRFNGTSWVREAHIYRYDGSQWNDISQ